MSDYTDKVMAKIQRELKAKEAKEASLNDPISMEAEDDANIDMDFDNSISDGEYAEDYFNEDASGDETKLDPEDLEEEETEDEGTDAVHVSKKKEDKKKKRSDVEIEEEYNPIEDISVQELTENNYTHVEEADAQEEPTDIIDVVTKFDTYESEIKNFNEASPADEAGLAVAETVVSEEIPTMVGATTADADVATEMTVADVIGSVVEASPADEADLAVTETLASEEIPTMAGATTADADVATEITVADVIGSVVEASPADEAGLAVAETMAPEEIPTMAGATTADAEVATIETPAEQVTLLIDNVIADVNDQQSADHYASAYSTLEHTDQEIQSAYTKANSSNEGYDTRAAVADMVPDEQIKSVTEGYTSPREQYVKEFVQTEKSDVADSQPIAQNINKEFTSSTQENDIRDLTSDKEAKTKGIANDSEESKETEQKQSEFKEQSLHAFSEVADAVSRSMERLGHTVVSNVVNEIVSADKNVKEGVKNFNKVTRPLAEAAAIMGMAALSSAYADNMKLLGKAGADVDKLVASGKLTAEDLLLSKNELNKTLKDAGISGADRKSIIKNKTDIHDMMGVRSEMRSMVATGQIKVDEKMSAVLQSSSFYDLRNKQMGQLLQLYYKNSSDDVIRNVFGKGNFTGKSSATFRKFMHKMNRNEVSVNGRAAVKMGKLVAARARSNRELSGYLRMKLSGTAKSMVANVTAYDRNTAVGFRTLSTATKMAVRSAKISKKVLIGTRRHGYRGLAVGSVRVVKKIMIGTKKHGYKGIATQVGRSVIRFAKFTDKTVYSLTNHSIGHFIGVSRNSIRNGTNALRNSIKMNGEIAKKKAILAAQKAKRKALSTAAGKQAAAINTKRINTTNAIASKYKNAQRSARKAAQKLAQTKAAKVACATGNAVAKGANLFIGTPMRFGVARKAKLVFGKIFNVFHTIKKALFMAAIGLCGFYIALVLVVTLILNVLQTDGTAIMNILLADRDEYVPDSIDRYLQKSQDIKDDAIAVGEGTPRTQTVTSGHTIEKYGHPDADGNWVQGYKIYYTDSAGNIIQDGANNVKDTMVLAYVQMDADWSNEENATELMDKYFKWLNPNSDHNTLLSNSEESDIYFCDGCETIYYKCNDNAIVTDTTHSYMNYSDVVRLKNNGTKVFGSLVSKINGDYYTTQCKKHTITNVGPDGKITIVGRKNHGSATNRAPTGCNKYTTTKYCTGHKVKVCYGHRDITIKIPIKTMQDAFNQNYMVSEHLFDTFLNGGQWTEEDQDWCWCLYNADWYDLYGKDPSGGVGFTAGSSLTEEQINNILDNCGSVSQIRQNIISSALSQVGSLPYYYGGKPTSGGLPIMTNHGQAGSTTSVEDHVGRTTAGLDCFGFCQWAYWNATGSNILPEGSSCTTTTVYNSTQCGNLKRLSGASELKVGDLGFLAGHVGIFAGVSDSGQLMWIHCNGSANTVSYGPYNGFTRFYRLSGLN